MVLPTVSARVSRNLFSLCVFVVVFILHVDIIYRGHFYCLLFVRAKFIVWTLWKKSSIMRVVVNIFFFKELFFIIIIIILRHGPTASE